MPQPSTIVLRTNTQTGADAINAVHYQTIGDKSTYKVTGHDDKARNLLDLFRTPPKRNGNSYGVRKFLIKRVKDVASEQIDGSTASEQCTVGLSGNWPVGVSRQVFASMLLDVFVAAFNDVTDGDQNNAMKTALEPADSDWISTLDTSNPGTIVSSLALDGDLGTD